MVVRAEVKVLAVMFSEGTDSFYTGNTFVGIIVIIYSLCLIRATETFQGLFIKHYTGIQRYQNGIYICLSGELRSGIG